MVTIGERDQAVLETETRAGEALREWTKVEGLTLAEMVEWCDGLLTQRERRGFVGWPAAATTRTPLAMRPARGAEERPERGSGWRHGASTLRQHRRVDQGRPERCQPGVIARITTLGITARATLA